MASLAEEIAKLTDPNPNIDDPEDDINSETVAKLSQKFDNDDTEEVGVYQVSSLRNRNAPLLDEIDKRYAGKRISRKLLESDLHGSSDLDSQSESEADDSEHDDSSFLDEKNIELFRKKMQTAQKDKSFLSESSLQSSGADEEFEGDEGEDEEEEEEDDDDDYDEDEQESAEDMVQKFSHIDVTEEIEKGKAVQKQQELWNKLCECRIKLQKLLIVANKLPQYNKWTDFKEKCDKPYSENLSKGYKSIGNLLKNFLELQSELMKSNPEMIINDNDTVKSEENEILSESEEEETAAPIQQNSAESKSRKRKLKLEDYGEVLAKRHKSFIPYRNSVIQKWDEKTRLSSGRMTQKSFNAFEQSAVKQIDQILQDKARLIRRTQLKRSVYRILGKAEVNQEIPETDDIKIKQDEHLKNYDPEIFDDDDFYRQLLKDVIESKSVGIDPLELSKQLDIQRIRSKMKRKVDTKASKGRKIRYDVHAKLLNHMAPMTDATAFTNEARNDLFSSIFGQAVQQL